MITASASTTASVAQVWAVFLDVESWPQWTESMTAVDRLDDGPLRVGSRATVRQPKMRPMVWEVTELVEQSSFSWQTRNLGVTTTGSHRVVADGAGSRIDLTVEHRGLLAWLIRLIADRRTAGYAAMEAAGLKAAAEAGSA